MSTYIPVRDITDKEKYYNDYAHLFESLIIINDHKKIVETGVSYGHTTHTLCKAAKVTGGHVVGIDSWDVCGLWNQFPASKMNKESVTEFLKENGHDNFTLHKKDTRDDDFVEFVKDVTGGEVDFAFIDACHSYQGISGDFRAIYPLLTKTGIIAFHDTLCVDGCREFMLDLRTKFNDGTFDVFDLNGGYGNFQAGVSFLVKKQFPVLGIAPKNVCGSPHSIEEIVKMEQELYQKEISEHQSEFVWVKETTKS